MDFQKLAAAISYFQSIKPEIKVDELTWAAMITYFLVEERGKETYESICDTPPRDAICSNANEEIDSASFDIADSEFLREEYTREISETGKFEPSIFESAIYNLNQRGLPVFLTNYHSFLNKIWKEYYRISYNLQFKQIGKEDQ